MMKTTGTMTISEIAARTDVPPKTIRYYEDIGVIRPQEGRENRYRNYGETDVQTLRFIHRARNLGFSLKDISALLTLYQDRERASREVKHLALENVSELDRKIAELTAIRNALADLAERCHGDDRPDCPILDSLEATSNGANLWR